MTKLMIYVLINTFYFFVDLHTSSKRIVYKPVSKIASKSSVRLGFVGYKFLHLRRLGLFSKKID